MITVSRTSLRLLSIAIGLLFTGTVYYTMHYNPRWDWTAPGIGQLPRDIVHGFMADAYGRGQGAAAHRTWFAPNAADNAPGAADRQDGVPIGDDVRQIVAQLLGNAIRFNRPGGSVRVSARQDEREAVLTVADSGPGIDPQVAQQLFTPFFTTRTEGMGLGLSMCRTVVEQHGGFLGHKPNHPRGTVFTFTLPVNNGATS